MILNIRDVFHVFDFWINVFFRRLFWKSCKSNYVFCEIVSTFLFIEKKKNVTFALTISMTTFLKKVSTKISAKVILTTEMINVAKAVVFTAIYFHNTIIFKQFFIVRFQTEYFSWSKNFDIFSMLFTAKLNDLIVMFLNC